MFCHRCAREIAAGFGEDISFRVSPAIRSFSEGWGFGYSLRWRRLILLKCFSSLYCTIEVP